MCFDKIWLRNRSCPNLSFLSLIDRLIRGWSPHNKTTVNNKQCVLTNKLSSTEDLLIRLMGFASLFAWVLSLPSQVQLNRKFLLEKILSHRIWRSRLTFWTNIFINKKMFKINKQNWWEWLSTDFSSFNQEDF